MPVEVGYLGQCLGQLGLANLPFLNEVVANHVFQALESMPTYLCHSTCGYVKQEAPKKLVWFPDPSCMGPTHTGRVWEPNYEEAALCKRRD